MHHTKPEVCVVGAGIIGSWTALHLAEAGVRTLLVEPFAVPVARGSSQGRSRAFRFLGDPELDRLEYSLDRWQALEHAGDEKLFVKTGLLNFGPEGDPYLEEHMAVARSGGRPCEWMGADDIAARFPMLNYPKEWGAAWDPSGGILLADRCLDAVRRRFLEVGGTLLEGRVESVEAQADGGVRVEVRRSPAGPSEQNHFDKAVVCAGPWTARLLPQLDSLLSCQRIPVTYWRDPKDSYGVAGGCPILFNARLTGVYALPSYEYPRMMKVLYHGGPEADPDSQDSVADDPHIERVREYVRDHLPLLDHDKPAILESCFYTMTPDDQPILDRLSDSLVVGAGFSGSGFKHSPATGQMLAALALEREATLPKDYALGRYAFDSPGRFPPTRASEQEL